ncbi:MAG: Hsp20/alpha crystallin family protein [Thermomicrobiales bacterium]
MIRSVQFGDIPTLQDWLTAPLSEALRLGKAPWPTQQPSQSRHTSSFAMPVDVYSTHDHAVIVAALPGVHPDDVEVTVHRNTATIRAAAARIGQPQDTNAVTWYVSELGRGTFERSITFPFAIDEQGVEAQFANGLLRLVLPRREQDRPQRIPVRVGGSLSPLSIEASANASDAGESDQGASAGAVAD